MNRIWLFPAGIFLACMLVIFGSWIERREWKPPAALPPVAAVNELDDSWVMRRMDAADKICGPVPFDLRSTRTEFELQCGRPERIRPLRILPKGGS